MYVRRRSVTASSPHLVSPMTTDAMIIHDSPPDVPFTGEGQGYGYGDGSGAGYGAGYGDGGGAGHGKGEGYGKGDGSGWFYGEDKGWRVIA